MLAVTFVGNFPPASEGGATASAELAKRLAQQGHQVRLTPWARSRIVRLGAAVWMLVRHRGTYSIAQVDVYSGIGFVFAEVASAILALLGKPVVLSLHGGNLPEFSLRWPRRVRRLLRRARVLVAPSRYLLERMTRLESEIRHIPNGLDTGLYPARVRTQPRPTVIWLRSFHDVYNPELAAKALAQVRKSFREATLSMIGPDKRDGSRERTRETAEDLGLTDRVEFFGGVPKRDVPTYLDRGDIFLNTSRVDNAPVSVLEAMASGMCVVSTNVGGMPYLLQDGQNALLVPPDDPGAMADAVIRILSEPGLAATLSKNALETSKQYDWSRILPQWERLFDEIVGDGSP